MKSVVITKATGGWSYSFELTEQQAHDILNARVGANVALGPNEGVRITSIDVAVHEKTGAAGYKGGEIDRAHLLEALREMIRENEWK